MRELIFRTYKRGVMDYIVELPFSEQVDLNGQIDGLIDMDYKVMQYIGLNDTNNIRIYEGDIVKPTQMHNENAQVVFYSNCWCFDVPNSGRDGWCERISSSSKDIKVIGNIYENPELLKDK